MCRVSSSTNCTEVEWTECQERIKMKHKSKEDSTFEGGNVSCQSQHQRIVESSKKTKEKGVRPNCNICFNSNSYDNHVTISEKLLYGCTFQSF